MNESPQSTPRKHTLNPMFEHLRWIIQNDPMVILNGKIEKMDIVAKSILDGPLTSWEVCRVKVKVKAYDSVAGVGARSNSKSVVKNQDIRDERKPEYHGSFELCSHVDENHHISRGALLSPSPPGLTCWDLIRAINNITMNEHYALFEVTQVKLVKDDVLEVRLDALEVL